MCVCLYMSQVICRLPVSGSYETTELDGFGIKKWEMITQFAISATNSEPVWKWYRVKSYLIRSVSAKFGLILRVKSGQIYWVESLDYRVLNT